VSTTFIRLLPPPAARGGPMLADLPLSELHGYVPDVAEPADFDEFWSGQLAAARAAARGAQARRRSVAHRASWWRVDSCSFRSTEETWVSTVLTEMNSSRAISL